MNKVNKLRSPGFIKIKIPKPGFAEYETGIVSSYLPVEFLTIEEELNKAKNFMDHCDQRKLRQILKATDLYRNLRQKVMDTFGAQAVTNAWLKGYELLNHANVPGYRIFFNAELPGAFISAANHYIYSKDPNKKFDWRASSLYPEDSDTLGDYYGIYSKNKPYWIMGPRPELDTRLHSGDITKREVIEGMKTYFSDNKVDVYMSDAGIDVSNDYNKQEEMTAKLHFGQALAGLLTLKKGGTMIIKHYTFVLPFTVSLISLLSSVFDNLYISKPVTSRPTNSEVYFIGENYQGIEEDLAEKLLKRLDNWDVDIPLTDLSMTSEEFMEGVLQAARKIHVRLQINFLKETKYFYDHFEPDLNMLCFSCGEEYIKNNPISILPNNRKLTQN